MLVIAAGNVRAQPSAEGPTPAPEVQKLLEQARELTNANKPEEASKVLEQARTLARMNNDHAGEGRALLGIGLISHLLRQPQKALEVYQQALLLLRQIQDRTGEALALTRIGNVYRDTGQQAKAIETYQQALTMHRQLGNRTAEANILNSLGNVYYTMSQPLKALEFYQQAQVLYKDVKDKMGQANVLNNMGSVASYTGQPQKALEAYQQALPLFRELKDTRGEAISLSNIGQVYSDTGQPQKALEFYQKALPLTRQTQEKQTEATVLYNLGRTFIETSQAQRAQEYLQKALALFRQTQDRQNEAYALKEVGIVYAMTGQPEKAIETYRQALPLFRQVQDKRGEAIILSNLGEAYAETGEPKTGLEYQQQALVLCRQTMSRRQEAITLTTMGNAYDSIGLPQKALEHYQQALDLFHGIGDTRGEAQARNNIGTIYREIGLPQKALEFFRQALPILQQTRNRHGEARMLANIGLACLETGQPQKALEFYRRALPIMHDAGDRQGEAALLLNIGSLYGSLDQYRKAQKFYRQALPLFGALGDRKAEANTLTNIGTTYREIGQPRKALEFYLRAIPVLRRLQDRLGEVEALGNLGSVYASLGQSQKALQTLRQATARAETYRANLSGLTEFKMGSLEKQIRLYHVYIDLLLQNRRTEDAFAIAQQTKARALLDLLDNARVDFLTRLTPEERSRFLKLRSDTEALNRQMVAESVQNEVGSKLRFQELQQQLRKAESAFMNFSVTLYSRHPDLALSRQARTLTLAQAVQSLPADTALLEYVTLKQENRKNALDRTVLFVVTRQAGRPRLKVYSLRGKTDEITRQADALLAACSDPRKPYRKAAASLYRRLLAPAQKQLHGVKHLLICPDGPLWNVPFAALHDGKRFLAERFELSTANSATGWKASLSKHSREKAPHSVLVLANPDFGEERRFGDNLAIPGQRPLDSPSRPLDSPSRDLFTLLRNGKLLRLPGAQAEADTLRSVFPDAAVFTGDRAQEAAFKQEAGQYRYLHLASHAFFNDAAPLLSSIVLADPSKGSEEDGFLTARELFDMQFNAEMVVLSACNTGRGEKRSGEGVIGLTWALSAAGVPSQILSQWSVDDAATAALMQGFYRNLKRGHSKAAALREAELALLHGNRRKGGGKPKWSHPYYWAPFILIGDWR